MLIVLVVIILAVSAVGLYIAVTWILALRRPDALEQLGVRGTYPRNSLPSSKIEAYCELKERLQRQYAKDNDSDTLWMANLPAQAKDMLKYRLMQRAIGDMAALQKIDCDARGYWRLFSKGIVPRKFWNSVMDAERDLSQELESVKAEAAGIEPTQDPQSIISDAMQFVLHYRDKLPQNPEGGTTADAIADLMQHLPPPGHPGHPLPPGHPGNPGMGPPFGEMPGQQAVQEIGGSTDTYSWRQDADELEVSVVVPNNANKKEVKVTIQSRLLRVEHSGAVLVEGQLAGVCCPEGSTWTLSKGRVVVSLEKADPRQWPTLLADKK